MQKSSHKWQQELVSSGMEMVGQKYAQITYSTEIVLNYIENSLHVYLQINPVINTNKLWLERNCG